MHKCYTVQLNKAKVLIKLIESTLLKLFILLDALISFMPVQGSLHHLL